jgi:hypothetical protein
MHVRTLGLLGSEEEEGAARGDRDDGDGHHGLGALPLQEIHGCARPPSPSTPGKSVGGVWLGRWGILEVAGRR